MQTAVDEKIHYFDRIRGGLPPSLLAALVVVGTAGRTEAGLTIDARLAGLLAAGGGGRPGVLVRLVPVGERVGTFAC